MYFAIITNYMSTFAIKLSVNDEITGKLQNHSFNFEKLLGQQVFKNLSFNPFYKFAHPCVLMYLLCYSLYRWFSRYVIAAMLVDDKQRSLISSFCLSTSICSFHHWYLCLPRLHENHLFNIPSFYVLSCYFFLQSL